MNVHFVVVVLSSIDRLLLRWLCLLALCQCRARVVQFRVLFKIQNSILDACTIRFAEQMPRLAFICSMKPNFKISNVTICQNKKFKMLFFVIEKKSKNNWSMNTDELLCDVFEI